MVKTEKWHRSTSNWQDREGREREREPKIKWQTTFNCVFLEQENWKSEREKERQPKKGQSVQRLGTLGAIAPQTISLSLSFVFCRIFWCVLFTSSLVTKLYDQVTPQNGCYQYHTEKSKKNAQWNERERRPKERERRTQPNWTAIAGIECWWKFSLFPPLCPFCPPTSDP